jgi:8-amino-7-oxononanoate synthase
MRAVAEFMELVEGAGALPQVRVIQGPSSEPVVTTDGREVLNFCSSNYLGLATHPEVKDAVIGAVLEYGVGANGSRLVSGTTDLHIALEEATARFKHTAAAVAFPTGYMANTGTIAALAYVPYFARMAGLPLASEAREMVVLSDALNHASIVEGCEVARARQVHYEHCDLDSLEAKLRQNEGKRLLIVTDGVFSMDGDIAPLPGIVGLAARYRATVLLDDAHATGVLGRDGRGTLEHFGLEGGADILQMGTYSKSYGALGGFLAADRTTADYLRVAARPYMFSGAVPPCLAAGILKAMEIAEREPQRRVRLLRNRDYLVYGLQELGLEPLGSGTPIVPIIIGHLRRAVSSWNPRALRALARGRARAEPDPADAHGQPRARASRPSSGGVRRRRGAVRSRLEWSADPLSPRSSRPVGVCGAHLRPSCSSPGVPIPLSARGPARCCRVDGGSGLPERGSMPSDQVDHGG